MTGTAWSTLLRCFRPNAPGAKLGNGTFQKYHNIRHTENPLLAWAVQTMGEFWKHASISRLLTFVRSTDISKQ